MELLQIKAEKGLGIFRPNVTHTKESIRFLLDKCVSQGIKQNVEEKRVFRQSGNLSSNGNADLI